MRHHIAVVAVCCVSGLMVSGCSEDSEFEFQSELGNAVERVPESSNPIASRNYTFALRKQNLSALESDDVELGTATCFIEFSRIAWKDAAIWALSRCNCFCAHSGNYYFGSEPPVVRYVINGDDVEFLLTLEFLFARHEDGPLHQSDFNDINFGEVYTALRAISIDTTAVLPDTLTFTNGGPVNDTGNTALIRLRRAFHFRNTESGLQAAEIPFTDASEVYKLAGWFGPDTYSVVESSDLLQLLPAGDVTKTMRPVWQGQASSNGNGRSIDVTFPGIDSSENER